MSSESAAHTLYCSEDAADLDSSDADTCIPHHHHHPPPPFTSSSHHSPPSDEGGAVAELIDSEARHMPEPDYLQRCRNMTARQDSVNWILKIHARHRFSPATAFLSVNYFDRFLSSCSLPKPNGWPFQLLSVACLSLAAKMEEPRVPLLLDLQMCDPKYVFEPKTVQKMELWVMSNLDWRLRSVTPFDFLHFFISKLPSSSSSSSSLDHQSLSRIFSASSDLVLNTTRGQSVEKFRPIPISFPFSISKLFFFFVFSLTSMFKIAVFLWLCSSDRFSTVHAVDDGCSGGALRYSGNLRRSLETVS